MASNTNCTAPKRKLSMTSIANSTVSSLDTSISDTIDNDPDVLARREKNIRYGKNTEDYKRYVQLIPKRKRISGSPRTPIKEMKYSRRQWDGLIKHWKLRLHNWERDSKGVESNPTFSTPKRQKTSCDRRSACNNIISPVHPPVRAFGDMLPPSIKMMVSKDEDDEQDEKENIDTEVIDWSKPSDFPRIMDWSKDCETSEDESDLDVSQVNECTYSDAVKAPVANISVREQQPTENKNEQTQTPEVVESHENINCSQSNTESKSDILTQFLENLSKNDHGDVGLQNDGNNVEKDEPKGNSNGNIASDAESSKMIPEEEGTVYKCISLVEAISAFDDKTYNEDEDEDYLPPEERGLKLEEIGLDASDDDSDSEPETLFYRIVQENQPYRSKKI